MHHDSSPPPAAVDEAPSRSQQRREALAILALAERLVSLSPSQQSRLALPEPLRDEVENVRRISAHGARKRQMAFLAKQLRREDPEWLEDIHAALTVDSKSHQREVATEHRLEHIRQRLLAEGDAVVEELAGQHPDMDRQRLRALMRQAQRERDQNKPPRAFRELLRYLRAL